MIVTFEGNILPSYISINSVFFPVETYIGKVTQCYNCLRFGHISKQCRSPQAHCIKCGKIKNEDHTCQDNDVQCIHCDSKDHVSISKKCPKYEHQKKIKNVMIEQKISFIEAKNYCESSFSGLLIQNRYSTLDNIEDSFPPLPTSSKKSSPSTTTHKNQNISNNTPQSQPSSSHYNIAKKRKISPNQTQNNSPMFPFNFGPSKPLPANLKPPICQNKSDQRVLETLISNYIFNLITNIQTVDDIKTMSQDSIYHGIKTILEDITHK
uniref:Uncharacterized protein LOC114344900 n=1 Tax=Diabrotica virgifera virgifera TaxID=50390 RepID=A0A6P7GPJ9_DIAVI